MNTAMKEMVAALRQERYKLTPQRRAVLKVIVLSKSHLTPRAIYNRACQEHPNIGLVTVYRTMNILHKLGFICEVRGEGNHQAYLFRRIPHHHHHLVCVDCGAVIDFTDCGLDNLEHRLSRETGFLIQEHILEFHGLCPKCRGRVKSQTSSKGDRG
jgi:Fur family ferric uptake transcriptional regulator